MGRPKIQITAHNRQQIEILAGFGLPLDQIAAVVGVSARTMDTWKKDPEINQLFISGKARAAGKIAQRLYEKADSGDLGAIIWYEKTRCGRTERPTEQASGDAGQGQVIVMLPSNQRDEKR